MTAQAADRRSSCGRPDSAASGQGGGGGDHQPRFRKRSMPPDHLVRLRQPRSDEGMMKNGHRPPRPTAPCCVRDAPPFPCRSFFPLSPFSRRDVSCQSFLVSSFRRVGRHQSPGSWDWRTPGRRPPRMAGDGLRAFAMRAPGGSIRTSAWRGRSVSRRGAGSHGALTSCDAWRELIDAGVLWGRACGSPHVAHRDDEWHVLEEFAAPRRGWGSSAPRHAGGSPSPFAGSSTGGAAGGTL